MYSLLIAIAKPLEPMKEWVTLWMWSSDSGVPSRWMGKAMA